MEIQRLILEAGTVKYITNQICVAIFFLINELEKAGCYKRYVCETYGRSKEEQHAENVTRLDEIKINRMTPWRCQVRLGNRTYHSWDKERENKHSLMYLYLLGFHYKHF